ncbi:C-GCAxxG-C-C family (seleno)protein [Anaerovorax odorimutans]|uniref:C-GCAxxG-C-C family (seleno)protein n=1 Tax=Anaerovorax odorimutans TaxID=109327 RepID=UPI00042955B7|nr:C-GCAxxG-C-C family (seleno)protein [Anaerovorax odorimutans]
MPIKKAINHFLGKNGHKRMNCAQAVINAFKEKYDIDDDTVKLFRLYGSGRAPEGICGAYFAARFALEKKNPEKLKDFEKYFIDQAGSIKCHEIRSNRKLSCLGCVEKSAEYL